MQEYFKIGELSKLYHISVDSLRYYEQIGLLKPVRSESGYRHYKTEDIWRLNVIRDLRELDFSMEQIGRYLQSHSTDSTLALLSEEQEAISRKIRDLIKLRENVCRRQDVIRQAREQPMDRILTAHFEERRCYSIPEGYSDEHEMDVLIKRLLNMDADHLYVIGSNQIGTAISAETARKTGEIRYAGVFVIDENGDKILPAGDYLTVTYAGSYEKSRYFVRELLRYAREQNIRLQGDVLELLLVDIHVSADEKEHITQLQVRME